MTASGFASQGVCLGSNTMYQHRLKDFMMETRQIFTCLDVEINTMMNVHSVHDPAQAHASSIV